MQQRPGQTAKRLVAERNLQVLGETSILNRFGHFTLPKQVNVIPGSFTNHWGTSMEVYYVTRKDFSV